MGKIKTLTPSALWYKGFYIMFGLRPHNISKTSHLCRLVTMQKYNEFPKQARNVNFVLTFEKRQNLRKIAAKNNTLIYNLLKANILNENKKRNMYQWKINDIFYGLPP